MNLIKQFWCRRSVITNLRTRSYDAIPRTGKAACRDPQSLLAFLRLLLFRSIVEIIYFTSTNCYEPTLFAKANTISGEPLCWEVISATMSILFFAGISSLNSIDLRRNARPLQSNRKLENCERSVTFYACNTSSSFLLE